MRSNLGKHTALGMVWLSSVLGAETRSGSSPQRSKSALRAGGCRYTHLCKGHLIVGRFGPGSANHLWRADISAQKDRSVLACALQVGVNTAMIK